jgi:hypothetical protein
MGTPVESPVIYTEDGPPFLIVDIVYDTGHPISADRDRMIISAGATVDPADPDATKEYWTHWWNESGLSRYKLADYATWDAMNRFFTRTSQTGNVIEVMLPSPDETDPPLFYIGPKGSVKLGVFTTSGLPSPTADDEGAIAYDTTRDCLVVTDGSTWKKLESTTDWTNISTFGTNKSANSNRTPRVRKNGDFIELQGTVDASGGFANAALICTLPSGFRPTYDVYAPVAFNGGISINNGVVAAVRIESDGDVIFVGSSTAAINIPLDSIRFGTY